MRAAVLICVVALAAAPAMAGWGLRTDKWMEGVTVTSSPFTGGQRLKNPTAGVFPKHWKKALEKQGCWNEKDWPIRY